jgi:Mg-chelatase subunit ChlI
MTRRFEAQVVVVAGGSTGIGRAVARRVASEGAAVVTGARREDVGKEAAGEIEAAGGRSPFVATDVTVEAEAVSLVRAAVTKFGRLDGASAPRWRSTAALRPSRREDGTEMTEMRKAKKPALEGSPVRRQRRGRGESSGRQHGRFFRQRTAEPVLRFRHVLLRHRARPVEVQR